MVPEKITEDDIRWVCRPLFFFLRLQVCTSNLSTFCCIFFADDIRPQDAWSELFRLNWIAKEPHAEASLTLGRVIVWKTGLCCMRSGGGLCMVNGTIGRIAGLFCYSAFLPLIGWKVVILPMLFNPLSHFRCKPRFSTLSLAPEFFAISYKDQCFIYFCFLYTYHPVDKT